MNDENNFVFYFKACNVCVKKDHRFTKIHVRIENVIPRTIIEMFIVLCFLYLLTCKNQRLPLCN